MRRCCLLLIALVGLLAGCTRYEFYEPYTLRHLRTGAEVTCGHWIWWECLVYDYERHGYQRLQPPPRGG
jgi:hypothetical protein